MLVKKKKGTARKIAHDARSVLPTLKEPYFLITLNAVETITPLKKAFIFLLE